jgi:hypothetical protein
MKRAELNTTERYPRKWGTRSSHHPVLSLIGAGEGRRALDVADFATYIGLGLDADELDISTDLPASRGSFDRVVFADVLEHLPVRAQLIFGRFQYSDRRILDNTHLRFFT